MDADRTSRHVADEDYAAVLGKVFVSKTSYSVDAYQVVGRTKCYVRAVRVPLVSAYVPLHGDGSHKIDWQGINKPAPGSNNKRGNLYGLKKFDDDIYCLHKTRDEFHAFMVEDGSEQTFATVEY